MSKRTKCCSDRMTRIHPIIKKWDPEGLIGMGAPRNEYEHEVERIANSDYRIYKEADAVTVICEVFNDSFGALFGVKPGVKPKSKEGYCLDGYDGERIALAGKAVFEAIKEHRKWLKEPR